jgi:hypothetical protein
LPPLPLCVHVLGQEHKRVVLSSPPLESPDGTQQHVVDEILT